MPTGPKGEKRPADVIGNAVHVMRIATGEIEEGAPVDDDKDKDAQALGAKGGRKRADTMTPERRVEIAKNMRRFTRLTNGFSKKFENHVHMVALYTVFYNFVTMHKTLRMTPGMAAGVADRLWSAEDLAVIIYEAGAKPAKRGPYKKQTF